MSEAPKILAFAGSLRKDSYNKKLVRLAARLVEGQGGQVAVIDLAEYPLPVFDEDLEAQQGRPDSAARLVKTFLQHDALLIASPEYNSSLTAALKNAIDWISRPVPDQPPLAAFRGKVCAIMAASPGALGGLRGLVHLRAILGNIGVIMLPDQIVVSAAHEAFDDSGNLKDKRLAERLEGMTASLIDAARRFHS